MTSVEPPRTALTSRAVVVLGLAAALFAIVWTTVAPTPAAAADLREFSAGNIITDQVFFDEGSMAPGAVQAFLDDKGSACVRGADGTACLRHYRMDTSSRSVSTYCPGGYQGAAQETAATIIYKVAQACRVNPQVLVVMLQKEMGLVRTTNPTAKMYSRAMGYGCPDNSTGVCDAAYYGLQNQLYSAASQFQRYVKNPTSYSYRAGITNYILYHPYNNCGRQAVFIQNGATAALYNYTPYVPNTAALNAGYGTGDGCSSYGNRNFFSYFTDWFGSTQSTGSGAVNLKYMALGGSSSSLGLPVAATQCDLVAGGCARAYEGGSIYWSPSSGAAMVQGDVRAGWWNTGGITGPMGYPIADSGPITGGAAGAFQGGSVYWSAATGAHAVHKELLPNWWGTGGVSGPLGWPVASSGPVAGGKAGAFQGGSIYWSAATGAHWLAGEVRTRYWAMGSTTSEVGFPTSDLVPVGAGQAAAFENASIYWSAGTGAHAVHEDLLTDWWASGGVDGPLGWPVASSGPVAGGKAGAFEGGSIYWSAATGAHWLAGEVRTRYWALGSVTSDLGFPTSDLVPAGVGKAAAFENGSIYWSPASGAAAVHEEFLLRWWGTGGVDGDLGWPVADTGSVPGGKTSAFQGGSMFWSAGTGAYWLAGDVLDRYERADAAAAVLGFPIADQGPVTGGQAAAFQGGSIYSSPAGAYVVRGDVRGAWWGRGGIAGPLGFPTADTAAATGLDGASGQVGRFTGGALFWSAATGGKSLSGPVLASYDADGGPSELGFPIADQGPVTGGQAVALQGASIYWSSGTGAHTVRGEVRSAWWSRGGISGPLGFPTADTGAATGLAGVSGQTGRFTGGAVYLSRATGTRVVSGAVLTAFDAAGGSSVLGFPIADQGPVTGGEALALQDASIYRSASTGAHMVRGEVRANWWARGGITGSLGFPTTDTAAVTGPDGAKGQTGTFSGGAIYSSAATGARVLSGAVLTAYRAAGGPAVLGFPVADQGPVTGGQAAALQGGSIYWSATTGAHVVRGNALHAYWAAGSVTGPLGFPTAGTTALTAGGLTGDVTAFAGGSIYSTATTGTRVVLSAVDSQYRAAGGPASGYGWPTSSTYTVTGGVRNDFQTGQITG